jgi:DNA-binding transcriptional MerR regulator
VTGAGTVEPQGLAAAPGAERRLSLREAAKVLEVPEARLRAIARAGLLAPQRGPIGPITFGFRDLLLLRTTKGMLDSGVPLARIRRIWSALREQLASDVPLTSVTIRADGENVVATDGVTAWQPDSGQFLFDFEAREIAERMEVAGGSRPVAAAAPNAERPAGPRPMPPTCGGRRDRWTPPSRLQRISPPSSATSWASSTRAPPRSRRSRPYQRAVELDPWMADAHVNLGRLYHLTGERGRAEAHYRDAVKLAPDDPVPHFNLGVLLEEQGAARRRRTPTSRR